MKNLEQLLTLADLYGFEVVISQLKKRFTLVSYRDKSIPTGGSPTWETGRLKEDLGATIQKAIQHKNGEVTLITSLGYLKFTN
jgi:hypothetical protein